MVLGWSALSAGEHVAECGVVGRVAGLLWLVSFEREGERAPASLECQSHDASLSALSATRLRAVWLLVAVPAAFTQAAPMGCLQAGHAIALVGIGLSRQPWLRWVPPETFMPVWDFIAWPGRRVVPGRSDLLPWMR